MEPVFSEKAAKKHISRRIKTNSIKKYRWGEDARINACGDSRLRGQWSRKPIGLKQWIVYEIDDPEDLTFDYVGDWQDLMEEAHPDILKTVEE